MTSRLVNGVVTSNSFSGKYLVKDSNNNFSYNTKVINEYVDMVSNKIDDELISLESGKYQSEIFNNSVFEFFILYCFIIILNKRKVRNNNVRKI